MQPRPAVTEVVRVVARQHTRIRGLLHEVALSGGTDRTAAAGWLSHYLLLHVAAEQIGLRRAPVGTAERVDAAARMGPLAGLALTLDLDDAVVHHRVATLEAAVLSHARAQERSVLPRMLSSWPLADLHRAVAALEAADTVFDHGPAEPAVTCPGTLDPWHTAVGAIQRVLETPPP
ncbi:hypothetical protein [Humibacillus xanthopallidus]|uniref:hypothetical protein n=1 Tax=Humibacillus xanthopallidus TaxID=412689 RepID=UPI00384D9B37